MSAATMPAYRFASAAQWARCLDVAEPYPVQLDARAGEIVATFDAAPDLLAAPPDGEPVWISAGRLERGDCAWVQAGPVQRVAAGRDLIWLLVGAVVIGIDPASFQIVQQLDAPGALDIAGDGADGLWLLTAGGPCRPGSPVPPGHDYETGWSIAQAAGKPVLLAAALAQVRIFAADGRAIERTIDLHDIVDASGRWFAADRIESGDDAVLLAGQWTDPDAAAAPEPGFVYLDSTGEAILLGRWYREIPVMIASAGDDLLALFAEADGRFTLRRFADRSDARARRRITPVLASDTLEGRWVSAEIRARLPEGATLSLRWAATRDDALATTITAVLADTGQPASTRRDLVEQLLAPLWSAPVVYRGEPHDGPAPAETFNFPLHDVPGNLLWAEIEYVPGESTEPVALDELVLRHDGRTLRDDLPAIFRAPEGGGDGTLLRLAATLEGTTRQIDRTIARLGDWLDPERAPDAWLPRLAALLDIPFSELLDAGAQRRLVGAAAPLLTGRGTRDGLLALLEALFPGRPYAVEDRAAALAPLTLGSGALPALLTGASPRVPRLNARLVLGRTPLCPTSPCDQLTVRPPADVLVTIPVRPWERRRFGDSVARMIDAMLPASVRARLRWIRWDGVAGRESPVLTTLSDPPPLRLGDDPALGRVKLGGRGMPRLGEGGVPVGHRMT